MQTHIDRVEAAIRDLKQGKMIILTDDADRENEGDLIIPAENITSEQMNFMIRQGTGIVCLSLTAEHLKKFDLPLMVPRDQNSSLRGTPFTVSIDATVGITTGVSAADRVETVKIIMNEHASAQDIVKPGHIFPLQACNGGVLERRGHTEGAIDLARLAGFKPGAVLCEIMNPDGTMMRGIKLCQFAARHSISMLSIEDIVTWRLMHESLIAEEASAVLPVDDYGSFNIAVFREKYSQREHVVLTKSGGQSETNPLVRIHSSCLTGDLFASRRCDCHYQLHHSLKRISEEGGMLIYLNQEGRGIGLLNKIKAYALQENGYDTVAANQYLGLPVDARNYAIAADILRKHGIRHIRLMSGNPDKINGLIKYGIQVDIETMPSFEHHDNRFYLQTKIEKMQHIRGYNHA